MLNRRNRTLALLLSFAFASASLNLFAAGALLDPRAARTQLKTLLLSDLNALQREAQRTTEDSVFTDTTIGMMIGALVLPFLLGSFNPDDSTSENVEGMLKANVLDHILDSNHVTAQSETAISFRLAPELCDKIALMRGGVPQEVLMICQGFLGANELTLTLEKLSNKEMRLSFTNGAFKKRSDFVFALAVSNTSLGMDVNLNGIRRFLEVATQSGLPIDQLLPNFEAFEGVAEVAVQFDNEGARSGCHDNGSICLVLNVLEPILVKSEPGKSQVLFRLGSSPASAPALELAGNGQSSFYLKLNVGQFDGDWGDKTAVRVPGLSGEIFVPRSKQEREQTVELRDLSIGKGAAVLAMDGSTFSLDLNKDLGRVVQAITLVWNEAVGLFLDATDTDLRLGMSDTKDAKCEIQENARFTVRVGKHKTARLKVITENRRDSRYARRGDCSTDNLMFNEVNRLTNAACDENSLLNVERGNVEFEQSYKLNKNSGGGSWKAAEGECIGMPKKVKSASDEL